MNEHVQAFFAAVDADDDLKAQVKAATSTAEVIALASDRGITLTEADLVAITLDGTEISDEDLECASGGDIIAHHPTVSWCEG